MTLWHVWLEFLRPSEGNPNQMGEFKTIQFEVFAELADDALDWAEAWISVNQPDLIGNPWRRVFGDHIGSDPKRTHEEIVKVWFREYKHPYTQHMLFSL